MSDIVHVFTMQSSFITRLKEKVRVIDERIESGATVTLDLSDNTHRLSLKISRNAVTEIDRPDAPKPPALQTSTTSLVELVSNNFSLDIGEINRQVIPSDIDAQIKEGQKNKTASVETSSSSPGAAAAPSVLPNPALKYTGNVWVLAEDTVYAANDGFKIIAKNGYQTDLASVPRLFWALIAPFELSIAAPLFHDLLYRSAGEVVLPDGEVAPIGKVFTRAEADDLFLELMTRAKISYWKRNAAYLAVKFFAESAWRKLARV